MNEIWKPVKDFEQYYLISSVGRVKTIKTGLIRKLQLHKDGYLCLLICVNRIRYTKYVHRLIAEAFIDNPLNLNEVNHIDGNKLNNNINNLEWCTHYDNVQHAHKTGLIKSSKLSEVQILEIRKLKGNIKSNVIAKMYDVDRKTIYKILNNKSWKHLL